jgi:hypothetical protein
MLAAWISLAVLACTGKDPDSEKTDDSATPESPDPATVPLHGECDMAADFGGFTLTAGEDTTDLAGSVADGVVPYTVLEEIAAEGECRLLRRNNPYCDPACDAGEACDFDGNCVPYPVNQDLGTVTVTGLFAAVSMTPVFPGNTYFDTDLPHPAFDSGDLVTVSLPDAATPLALYGVGVEALVPESGTWTIEAGQDLTVRWTAPTAAVSRSSVALHISIDQHGASPSSLHCAFEDDGEATVPGAILQALVDVGVTGFPNGSIERRTVDNGSFGGGCMDFAVTSPRTATIDVVGFTPCITTNECPHGQTCDKEFQICR